MKIVRATHRPRRTCLQRALSVLARCAVAVLLSAATLLVIAGGSRAADLRSLPAAQPTTEHDYSVLDESCSGGLLCTPPWTTGMHLQATSRLAIEFAVPSSHCASLRLHVFVDQRAVAISGWLGWPGATGAFAKLPLDTGRITLGLVTPGTHVLGLEAEAQVGGCITDSIQSWAGTLRVFTSAAVLAPVTVHVTMQIATLQARPAASQAVLVTTAPGATVVVVIDYPDRSQVVLGPKQAGPDGHLLLTWTLPAGIHGTVHVTVDSAGKVAQGSFTVH